MCTSSQFGLLGRMETARQALEAAGSVGLSVADLVEVCDMGRADKYVGLAVLEATLLPQLTRYCAIYEDKINDTNRYYLDLEMDSRFEREILPFDLKEFFNGPSD